MAVGKLWARRQKGSVRLYRDGHEVSSVICYVSPEFYADFKKAGIRIVTWNIPIGWIGPNRFDYHETDSILEKYVSRDSEIQLLPRIGFPGNNNDWWCREHPEELVVLSNGELGSGHSSASRVWLEEASQALTEFIMHIERSDYAPNVIGYHICDGHFSEWFAWDSANFERDVHQLRWVCEPGKSAMDCPVPWPDYSEPMLMAFRDWLRRKYRNDVDAIRRAWNSPEVDFQNVTIPTKHERVYSENFLIREPGKQMNVIDYDLCFQDIHTDTMLNLCKVAKGQTKKLIGVFYGYAWLHFFRGFYMQNAGHLGLSKVIASPYVDFMASPYDYENRTSGGVNFSQSVPESITLNGKLFFSEMDPKTFLTDPGLKWHHLEHFKPRTVEETVEILKRDYSAAHSMGIGMWWMDLFNQGWFHHEEIVQTLRKLREIDERLLGLNQESNREIAVILDERGLMYQRACQNMMTSLREPQRQWELAFIGAPFDSYLQSDLLNPDFNGERYKLFIFMNNIFFDRRERTIIDRLVKRQGKVAIWQWAPGLISDEGMSPKNIRDLTGIDVECDRRQGQAHIDIANYHHPITEDLPLGHCFGPQISRWHSVMFKESGFLEDDPTFIMGPFFYCSDTQAITLGTLNPVGKPGFSVKQFDDWVSIYVSTPFISKDVLRNIAKFSGVHLYSEKGDLVYANEHFLSLCPRLGGKRIIRLPESKRVIDLWRNERISESTRSFEIDAVANRTYMYLLE